MQEAYLVAQREAERQARLQQILDSYIGSPTLGEGFTREMHPSPPVADPNSGRYGNQYQRDGESSRSRYPGVHQSDAFSPHWINPDDHDHGRRYERRSPAQFQSYHDAYGNYGSAYQGLNSPMEEEVGGYGEGYTSHAHAHGRQGYDARHGDPSFSYGAADGGLGWAEAEHRNKFGAYTSDFATPFSNAQTGRFAAMDPGGMNAMRGQPYSST
jgi:hypothetical protein